MTLKAKIDAAREAVVIRTKRSQYAWSEGSYSAQDFKNEGSIECANAILHTLLTEPPTEDVICHMLSQKFLGRMPKWKEIIRALRDAGYLYVREEG